MPISDKSVVDSACPLARRFRDHAGRRNQEVFLAAGLAMVLKDGTDGSAAT
jgi:adenosyl cobinamide kinase/adenosyl cobinamide phosphate guanylyltransferase